MFQCVGTTRQEPCARVMRKHMQKIPKDWGGLVLNSLLTQEPPQSLGANHPPWDLSQSLRKTFLHLWGWNRPRTHLPLKGLTTFQHSYTKRKASSPLAFRRQTMSNPQQHRTSSPLNPEETQQFWMSLHHTKWWQLSFTAVGLPCCSCLTHFSSGWTVPLSAPRTGSNDSYWKARSYASKIHNKNKNNDGARECNL